MNIIVTCVEDIRHYKLGYLGDLRDQGFKPYMTHYKGHQVIAYQIGKYRKEL